MKKYYLITEVYRAYYTPAFSSFALSKNIEYIYDDYEYLKTHFKIYYRCHGKARVKGLRVSDRGNVISEDFIIDKHTFINYLLNSRPLTDEEIELCKYLEEKYLRGV